MIVLLIHNYKRFCLCIEQEITINLVVEEVVVLLLDGNTKNNKDMEK